MQMDKKQKTLLIITIAAFSYLGYQVYDLVKQDVSNPPAATQTNGTYHPQMTTGDQVALVQTADAAPAEQDPPAALPQQQNGAPKQVQLQRQPLLTGQKAYLHMVNQYALAKMKRRLLDEQAAIAAAQHRIASLNKKTRDIDERLLNQPSSEYDADPRSKIPYQLSYLDNQHGQWAATLSKAGRYHEVNVGSELPGGVKILKINQQGVTLEAGDHRELITFNGVMPLTQLEANPKTTTLLSEEKIQPVSAKNTKAKETVLDTSALETAARKALVDAGILSAKMSETKGEVKATENTTDTTSATAGNATEINSAAVKEVPVIKASISAKAPALAETSTANISKVTENEVASKEANVLHTEVAVPATPIAAKERDVAVAKNEVTASDKQSDQKNKTEIKLADNTNATTSPAAESDIAMNLKTEPLASGRLALQTSENDVSQDPHSNDAANTAPNKLQLAKVNAPLNSKARYTEDENRILHMRPHDYTIQLIGSYHRDIVENFAIANDLGNNAMQFHVNNRTKPWYTLLYGDYRTLAQAQHALRQLPPNLVPEHPWIRRVSDVQSDVRQSAS